MFYQTIFFLISPSQFVHNYNQNPTSSVDIGIHPHSTPRKGAASNKQAIKKPSENLVRHPQEMK